MSDLEEKVARALAERMHINYDTILAGERNHLHRDAQAVIPIVRKQISEEIKEQATEELKSLKRLGVLHPHYPAFAGLVAGLYTAIKIIEQGDDQ